MNAILIMEDVSSFVTIQLVAITVHATTVTHSMLTNICVMVSWYDVFDSLYAPTSTIDFDECVSGSHGCNQNCTNNDGSYLCYCMTGYHLMDNQRTCTGRNKTKFIFLCIPL